MANTINQPSVNPTRKLTAATVAVAVWGAAFNIIGLALKNLYPEWYDPEILLSVNNAVVTAAGFIAGWYVKDNPNVVVMVEETK
jgi:hypothetical protein